MSMLPVFETEKLILLSWIPEVDAVPAFRNYSNPNFAFCLSHQGYNTQEANIEIMQTAVTKNVNLSNEFIDGTGFWAIIEKQTQLLIGGIQIHQLYDINQNPTSNYEIGWEIHQESWGKGYATEAALIIIDYAFHTLNLPAIIAIIDPKNTASLKVAHKLGMTSLGITDNYYSKGQELFYIKS